MPVSSVVSSLGSNQQFNKRGQIKDAISISERPAEADDRAVPGHWEGDIIAGSNLSFIATLVERHSRYVMLVKVPSKDTLTVVNALIKHSKKLPTELYRSRTWDRGKELADHKRFTVKTNIDVFFFCDPQTDQPHQAVQTGVQSGFVYVFCKITY